MRLEVGVKEQVRKIVLACGGHFDDDLDPNTTTHLIAEAVGSLKHSAAVAHELPVASPHWVFESFRAQKLLDVKDFGLRLLEGIGICTAGLTMEEKESVAQQATDHGAQYDGRLELGFTSILIAHHPEGAKYEAAVANDIPVVHLAWFYACLEREMFVEEEEFALRPEAEDPSLQPTYIAVNQQRDAQKLIADLPEIVKKYRRSQEAYDEDEEDGDDWMDLLDGCVLYLLGFPPQMNTMLQHLIRTSMGTIYHNVVIHQVTHVVVSPSLSDKYTLEAIRKRVIAANAGDEVHFVSASWLIDCVKCMDIQPEELYPVELDVNVPDVMPDTLATGSVKDTHKSTEANEDASLDPVILSADLLQNGDGSSFLATLEKKTTPKKRTGIFSGYSFLLLCRDPDDKHLIKPMLKEIRGERGGAEAIALAAIDFPRLDPEQFSFISHAVVCTGADVDEQEALKMQERIHQVQRELRSTEDADETQERPHKRARHEKKPRQRMLQFVSDLWVNCSLAAKLKLSFASHDLFDVSSNRPRALFSSPVPLPGFNDVVASTSVYREVEQLVVMELLRLAGARVTRKLSSQNTHLICRTAFSMKLAKAAKWGLHVVTARWVVDSLLQGRRLDEDSQDFKVDTGSFMHTENEETALSQSSPRSAS
ncbi:DNA topoisomerase 2-binding protein 1 [Phytophthora citrophthora]|uniref:DNA topoisomerase 2-binding protein 1 n=1 Tax=Phytophthora citrophthora TaxID=4793 RepID=A0AAD9LIV5_9STRA|nr:DNA topoisomerase 2-binding protein 1 [Phytophthora citrophthora]